MSADDVLEILRRLDEAGIEWWVHGGWGLDALLGRQTRPHDDLDLVLRREHAPRLAEALPGFALVHDERPASFVLADARGRHVDVHPLRVDERGDGWQEQAGGREALWSRDALAGRGRIGGRDVRCTSPEFELASHAYPGHDDVDREDAQLLCERFGLARPSDPRLGTIHPKRVHARPRT